MEKVFCNHCFKS